MKRYALCSLVLLVLVGISSVHAVPILEGESDLTTASLSWPGDTIRVDWQVYAPGDPAGDSLADASKYLYLFQIENTTGSSAALDEFNITLLIPGSVASSDVGFDSRDLDSAPFSHSPVGDTESATILDGSVPTFGATATQVIWKWDSLNGVVIEAGHESGILYFKSPLPPTFGDAQANDDIPPSPWASTHQGGEKVPVPAPEPGSVAAMAGIAVFGLIGYLWRRRRAVA